MQTHGNVYHGCCSKLSKIVTTNGKVTISLKVQQAVVPIFDFVLGRGIMSYNQFFHLWLGNTRNNET